MVKKGLAVFTALLFLSSCGMNWENGGIEEFNGKCEQFVKRKYRDMDDITPDADATCKCLLDEAKEEYPTYEDFLLNKIEFFDAKITDCLVKK